MSTYRRRLHALLTPAEHRLFVRLDTPQKIQTFLDRLPVNFGLNGDTAMSPRSVLKARMAHCAEGAIFAAARAGLSRQATTTDGYSARCRAIRTTSLRFFASTGCGALSARPIMPSCAGAIRSIEVHASSR